MLYVWAVLVASLVIGLWTFGYGYVLARRFTASWEAEPKALRALVWFLGTWGAVAVACGAAQVLLHLTR